MHLLVVGHVTRDEVDGGVRLGGAASYAALAAARLGYETALVTVAPPIDPLLEPLRRAPRLSVHCVASDVMTTFALDYAGGQRRLWLRRRARPLVIGDVPAAWLRAPVAYVGPVAGECDAAFVRALQARFVGAGIQGWLRRTDQAGSIEPLPLAEAPGDQGAAAVERRHPLGGGSPRRWRGRAIVRRRWRDGRDHPRRARRHVTDAEGARRRARGPGARDRGNRRGRRLRRRADAGARAGKPLLSAGRAAAAAAARVVEGPGLGTLGLETRSD